MNARSMSETVSFLPGVAAEKSVAGSVRTSASGGGLPNEQNGAAEPTGSHGALKKCAFPGGPPEQQTGDNGQSFFHLTAAAKAPFVPPMLGAASRRVISGVVLACETLMDGVSLGKHVCCFPLPMIRDLRPEEATVARLLPLAQSASAWCTTVFQTPEIRGRLRT